MSTKRASHHVSPLRYPGGKAKLAPYMKALLRKNRLLDSIYVEPFAGGGGVGLALLLHGYVDRIILNDLSEPIHAFWRAILDEPTRFINRILTVSLTPDEWARQKDTFRAADADAFERGFAAFYLNRTNHSGVLNGGMIGGQAQSSAFRLDARFNREELAARIKRISRQADRITVTRLDAAELLSSLSSLCSGSIPFVYIDPPYYVKGRDLYYDFYDTSDHENLRNVVASLSVEIPWAVSYDNVPEICDLYRGYESLTYDLSYSVRNGRVGREIMFFSRNIVPVTPSEGGLERTSSGDSASNSSGVKHRESKMVTPEAEVTA